MLKPSYVVVRSENYERIYRFNAQVSAESVADYIAHLHSDESDTEVEAVALPESLWGVRVTDSTGVFYLGR